LTADIYTTKHGTVGHQWFMEPILRVGFNLQKPLIGGLHATAQNAGIKTALALALGLAVMCFGVAAVASSFLGK
jgi:hypothetical protein